MGRASATRRYHSKSIGVSQTQSLSVTTQTPVHKNIVIGIGQNQTITPTYCSDQSGHHIRNRTSHAVTSTVTDSGECCGSFADFIKAVAAGNIAGCTSIADQLAAPISERSRASEMFDHMRIAANDYPFMPAMIGSHGALSPAFTSIQPGPGGYGLVMTANTGSLRTTSGNLLKMPQKQRGFLLMSDRSFIDGQSWPLDSHYRPRDRGDRAIVVLGKYSDNHCYFSWITTGPIIE
jgi:hypothetical protein